MASATRTESIVTRLVGSLSSWLGRRDGVSDVRRRSAADINAIATDLRVSRTELQNLASHNCLEGADLLGLLRALGVDDVTLAREEPGVIRDMKLICSLCVARARCNRDVQMGAVGLHYREYCANSYTVDALKKMQRSDNLKLPSRAFWK